MAENGDPPISPENQQCLKALYEHWAKARLDWPMQAVARYDDVAKLLITIGGFLQTVLAAVYALMLKEPNAFVNTSQMRTIIVLVFFFLIAFYFSAAMVCVPQPKMQAEKLFNIKRGESLETAIREWCNDIDRIIKIKKGLLVAATGFFIISSLLMIGVFLNPFNIRL